MKIKIKKLDPKAIIPKYAKEGDAGLDLTAISKKMDKQGNIVYGTGLAMEIPEGYVGLVFPRSSNSKTDLYLTNHVGVIDSGYRGEIMFKYRALGFKNPAYTLGDRIGQIVIISHPYIQFIETNEQLSSSERSATGFGSSGR